MCVLTLFYCVIHISAISSNLPLIMLWFGTHPDLWNVQWSAVYMATGSNYLHGLSPAANHRLACDPVCYTPPKVPSKEHWDFRNFTTHEPLSSWVLYSWTSRLLGPPRLLIKASLALVSMWVEYFTNLPCVPTDPYLSPLWGRCASPQFSQPV